MYEYEALPIEGPVLIDFEAGRPAAARDGGVLWLLFALALSVLLATGQGTSVQAGTLLGSCDTTPGAWDHLGTRIVVGSCADAVR